MLLVIEVYNSSLACDQGAKLSLYARYGVPEYWVVDVIGRKIVKYSEPARQGYLKKIEIGSGVVSPAAFPQTELPLAELFG